MFSISSWNIRAMNQLPKQKEVQEAVKTNCLSVCKVLESHIAAPNLQKICDLVFGNWLWMSNASDCVGGTRIIIGWDPSRVDLMVLSRSDQVIHCQFSIISDNKQIFCSFIYAGNKSDHRREL